MLNKLKHFVELSQMEVNAAKCSTASYRVSHRTMSISIQEPSHGPWMDAIFRSQRTRKQLDEKYLIQVSCLPLRLVLTSQDVKLVRFALSPGWTKDQVSFISI
jgi:hypothetical protein